MTLYFTSEGEPSLNLDTEKWTDIITPMLENSGVIYKYDQESSVTIDILSKSMVLPILLYALFDMRELLIDALPHEDVTRELLAFTNTAPVLDEYDVLSLHYEHASFINKREKEVRAWIPLAIKKHIEPNHKRVKEIINGSI